MKKLVQPPMEVMDIVRNEYGRQKKTGKRMPIHSSSQAGRVMEQAHTLVDVALRSKYGPLKERLKAEDSRAAMIKGAAATAVACIRLIEKLTTRGIKSHKNKTNVINQDLEGQTQKEG